MGYNKAYQPKRVCIGGSTSKNIIELKRLGAYDPVTVVQGRGAEFLFASDININSSVTTDMIAADRKIVSKSYRSVFVTDKAGEAGATLLSILPYSVFISPKSKAEGCPRADCLRSIVCAATDHNEML